MDTFYYQMIFWTLISKMANMTNLLEKGGGKIMPVGWFGNLLFNPHRARLPQNVAARLKLSVSQKLFSQMIFLFFLGFLSLNTNAWPNLKRFIICINQSFVSLNHMFKIYRKITFLVSFYRYQT